VINFQLHINNIFIVELDIILIF